MKVRVYDCKKTDVADRYCMYFPYPKSFKERLHQDGRIVMGYCIPFNFSPDWSGKMQIQTYSDLEDDRTLGYNIPLTHKKVHIETLPKPVRRYIARMERIWNDAFKYNDQQHWNVWYDATI